MGTKHILAEVVDFYLGSADFNGIPVPQLQRTFDLSWPDLQDSLIELINSQKISLTFDTVQANPHIRMLPDLPVDDQVRRLQSYGPDGINAYPTTAVVRSSTDVTAYDHKPFTKRLLLGEPQLQPEYFELSVLDRYYGDPRYHSQFYDYTGSISISDLHYCSGETMQRDKVGLQTFGLGYDPANNRVIVVFLRYLSALSPEHQQYWHTYIAPPGCKMDEHYYHNAIRGDWVEHGSIYQAFLHEQAIINQMCHLMNKQPLFRQTYVDDRPDEFRIFLRPTRKNYLGFVHLLDKMLSENINREFFRGELSLEERIRKEDGTIEVRPRGTVALLDAWLHKAVRLEHQAAFQEVIEPFREVRRLRQRPAHDILEDEYDPNYHSEQNKLMVRTYNALRTLRLILALHPKARDCSIPDWLRDGKIKVY